MADACHHGPSMGHTGDDLPSPASYAAPRGAWTPQRRAVAEFAAGAATWGIWEAAEAAGHKMYVFPVLLLAWIAYFAVRGVRAPDLWQAWGLRVRNWPATMRWHLAGTAVALLFVGVVGAVNSTFAVPRYVWIIVAVYPVWAFCQQFVLQNGVVANFQALGVPRRWLPAIGMVAFAVVHLPNLPLAGLTALGGLLWTWLSVRAPNMWLLAVGHSIVGTAGFVWVLDRDPLANFPQLVQLAGSL